LTTYFSDISWLWWDKNLNDFARRSIIRLDTVEGALLWKYSKKTSDSILEIGRGYGGSTVLLLEATAGTNRIITSIDCNPDIINNKCKKSFHQYNNRLKLINEFSSKAIIKYNYDLLFIDGDHTYNGVKADTTIHWEKLNVGGFVVYHDYYYDAIKQFCSEWVSQGQMEKIEIVRSMIVFKKITKVS
jgi:predicted O-methyltransferase YrrM|tara:strand:- start:1797 stop:2357 length:561 start_codon:yes stop_codon:yes gene_type:complete